MTLGQITASDIAGWDSLDDIAASFEKRGLTAQPSLGGENELVLQLADDEFMVLVEAEPGEPATEYKPRDVDRRHTNLVATDDFEEFTFLTRVRTFGQQHGQIKHQKLSFQKSQFTSDTGEKHTILNKLNEIEYGSSAAIYGDLYDTRKIVAEFYEEFEALRTDLVKEVANVPADRGDAKRRYVQVTLDRMIFLYFIQEKRLLDRQPDYLHTHHDAAVEEGKDVYDAFYYPLFFEHLAEGKRDPDFGSLPYLNGGLFTKNPVEEEFPEARLGASPEETNALFGRILDFLSEWNWNVDERLDIVDPKNLSPAVLGHIFEQTVNQKEMGAYYTPEEITGFMARRSIQPYLLDQLNDAVGEDYAELDEVFALDETDSAAGEEAVASDGGTMTQQGPATAVTTDHVETLYFDILRDVRVLDPAVGSGAFLLAAQDVLLDVYLQCLEFFEEMERAGKGWDLAGRTRDELEQVQARKGSKRLYAKREIILHNLYGVDIDDGAVEICKLRLWLSMVADIEDEPSEVEPLPNIDFNIRQGNSLIGYLETIEPSGNGDVTPENSKESTIGDWTVRDRYQEISNKIRKHKHATNSEEASKWRNEAEQLIEKYRGDFDAELLKEYHSAGLEEIDIDQLRGFSPFHWPLEYPYVWAEGGFDVILGNPPWDMLYANRDDFFVQRDERFRTYSSDKKDKVMEKLLEEPEVAQEWENYQSIMDTRAEFFTESSIYELQAPQVGGRTMPTKNELSALFLERIYNLADDGNYVSLILPWTIFGGVMGKDLRTALLDHTDVETLVGFENKGIFEDIDDRYRFAILTFAYGNQTTHLKGIFNQRDLGILFNIEEITAEIPREVLVNYSPEAGIFPSISSEREADLLAKVVDHPPLDRSIANSWSVDILTKEFVESTDKDRLQTSSDGADYPVYGGKNIHQFQYDNTYIENLDEPMYWSRGLYDPDNSAQYRVREKKFNRGNLKRAIYDAFGGEETNKSQKKFVNDILENYRDHGLNEEDVLLDCTEYRIGIRDVTNSTNERTIISTVLPKNVICLHTINTFKPFTIEPEESHLSESPLRSMYVRRFTDDELFVANGLLNSIAFDFLMRTKVETHIIKRDLLESQMPRLTDGDNWFHYIADRAARLNCYGEAFAEMRERLGGIEPATEEDERRRLQAEIDAAAFHAYGLDHEDTAFVLNDFHRVENPRLMDEPYFEMVLEKYEELAETGPHK